MKKPRPVETYAEPHIPTLEKFAQERRKFLKQAGVGVLVLSAGGFFTFCNGNGEEDDDTSPADDDTGAGDDDTYWDDDDGGIGGAGYDDPTELHGPDLPVTGEPGVTLPAKDTGPASTRKR